MTALHAWKMFDIGWVRVIPEGAPVEVGTTVAVLARHYGFWSLNPCRIVYTFEEDDGGCVRRGFAYGTLPGHDERGEERFTVVRGYEMSVPSGFAGYGMRPIDRDDLLLTAIRLDDLRLDRAGVEALLKPSIDAVWNACGRDGSPNFDAESRYRVRR